MMRRPWTHGRIGAACITVLLLVTGIATVAAASGSAELLGFQITLVDKTYDPVKDESTWTYRVIGLGYGPHDLSHWRVALCLPGHAVVRDKDGIYKTSHPEKTKVDTDKHTKFHGIKFDIKVDKNNGDTLFWFVLKGDWEVGPVWVGGKAGQPVESGKESGITVLGPTCQAVTCQLNADVSHYNTDWRLMRPGTYATKMAEIFLSGNAGAQITFADFNDIHYVEDSAAPAISVQYAISETLPSPNASTWMSAATLNATTHTVSAATIDGGHELTLWGRISLADFNYSSEYENIGRISVGPVCQPVL